MSEDSKKISFGFSKLAKPKVSILSVNKEVKSDESVQYIDCLEEKSIKVKNELPKQPEFLVIPLPKKDVSSSKRRELLDKILNSSSVDSDNDPNEVKIDKSSILCDNALQDTSKVESLDEKAAREIIEDLKNNKNSEDENNIYSVPLPTNTPLAEKESTIEDYESVPVDKFGMAMLRGMGWAPGKGIGKNEKVVAAKLPVLRPKGLGLGADKVIKKEENSVSNSEPIKVVKGSFVRIIAGAHKDLFGEIISFDDETGRLIVKMALGGSILTFNEFLVQPVSKEEFNKNSKVINVKKYEEYKQKENSKGVIESRSQNESRKMDKKSLKADVRLEKYKKNRSSSESSENSVSVRKNSLTNKKNKSSYSSSELSDNEDKFKKTKDIKKHGRSSEKSQGNGFQDKYKSKYYDKHDSPSKSKSSFENRHNLPRSSKTQRSSSDYSSPDKNKYKSNDYKSHSKKNYQLSSSSENFRVKSREKHYDRHVSRKESNKFKDHVSISSDSSSGRCTHSNQRKSKTQSSDDSDSTSDNSYKEKRDRASSHSRQKLKKQKDIKKRTKHNRSLSTDRKKSNRSPSPKKHKKHKRSKYD